MSIALDITERTLLGEHLLQCLAKAPHGNLPLRNDGDPVEAACARLAIQVSTEVPRLSPREVTILSYVSRGMRNAEIAHYLGIGSGTVKWHLEQVYRKLHVSNRMEAIHRARVLKLLDEDGGTGRF